MAKIYVVIVTYNGEKWIRNCLESLKASTVPITPIVIDNCSTDSTISIIEKKYPKTVLIKSKNNLGFGKANNVGLKKALDENCDYIFLLNQDAWIEPNTIEILVNLHKHHPEYGIISPLHVNAKKDKLDDKFIDYICRNPYKPFLSDIVLHPENLHEVYPIYFVNAAAWLISRKCLEIVGGFDPIFPHYGEDNDYIQRAKRHQFKIGLCPKTTIVHDREGTVKQTDLKKSYAKNYTSSLKILKNLEKPLTHTFLEWSSLQLRQMTKAVLELDITYLWMKVKLLLRVFYNFKSIAKSRANSKNLVRIYL